MSDWSSRNGYKPRNDLIVLERVAILWSGSGGGVAQAPACRDGASTDTDDACTAEAHHHHHHTQHQCEEPTARVLPAAFAPRGDPCRPVVER